MVKPKKILVPWSGGVDSTYLIQKLLDDGHNVSAVYLELRNNEQKTKRELAAIRKILKQRHFTNNERFEYLGVVASFETKRYGGALDLAQPLAFLVGIV